MQTFIMKLARRVRMLLGGDSLRYKGITLPARHYRLGGLEFQDDEYFLASARKEAERLVTHFGLTRESRVLDVGCGVGRLAIGILSQVGDAQYRGIDVNKRSIDWCNAHIARDHPSFRFIRVDVRNMRYNPASTTIDDRFRLPFEAQDFDIIYLYSVFSHMLADDVRVYLREFDRLLKPSGKIFLTGFLEDGVPDVEVNPRNYRMEWSGPLHCVRYNKQFFETLLAASGFGIDRFIYEQETDGQSALYISRRPEPGGHKWPAYAAAPDQSG